MIEAIVRIAVVYLILVVAMRLMGRRMASQTTRNEIAALVSLAGGMGPAIQDPRQGLVAALVAASVVVGFQRFLAWMMTKSERIELITQGRMTLLVCDGTYDIEALKQVAISRERLAAHLRSEGVRQLGSVDRLYLELNGAFTLIQASPSRPGLSLVPAADEPLRARQSKAENPHACVSCGHTQTFAAGRCPACRGHEWEPAVC